MVLVAKSWLIFFDCSAHGGHFPSSLFLQYVKIPFSKLLVFSVSVAVFAKNLGSFSLLNEIPSCFKKAFTSEPIIFFSFSST